MGIWCGNGQCSNLAKKKYLLHHRHPSKQVPVIIIGPRKFPLFTIIPPKMCLVLHG